MKKRVSVQGELITLGGRLALSRFGTEKAISKRSIHQYVSIDERFFCSKSAKDGLPYVQSERLQKMKGFTLLEILIALSIFALLATITSSSLYYAFSTRTKVNLQADRLNKLQLAISIIQQDTSQIIDRAIRGNEMRLFPVIVGQSEYMEFTRDGIINPKSKEKRSTLKRIAFACLEGQLIHRTWNSLDPIDRNKYQDRVLIDNLDDCHFSYLNHNLQSLPEWREQALSLDQRAETFPTALQINLSLKDWGKINLLFIVPEALYAPT